MFLSAKPVWFSPECKPDEYIQATETLSLSALPGSAILRIAADSDYTVFVNGQELTTHRCGYTAFRVEITEVAHPGENLLAVKLDTTENASVPPFGFVIDYLTYGGLYREAWLDVREQSLISDLYITTPTTDSVRLEITAENALIFPFLMRS
jgi:beta-galactosidase/beta-glucuronidase